MLTEKEPWSPEEAGAASIAAEEGCYTSVMENPDPPPIGRRGGVDDEIRSCNDIGRPLPFQQDPGPTASPDTGNDSDAADVGEPIGDAEAQVRALLAGSTRLCEGLTRNGFPVPLSGDANSALASLGCFLSACGSTSPVSQDIMLHVDYLAAKVGVKSASILSGQPFEVTHPVLRDALANIGSVLIEAHRQAVTAAEAEAAAAEGLVAAANDLGSESGSPCVTVGAYRRMYHYHLKKCGGSTLNQWLDTLTADRRAMNPKWTGAWLLGDREAERARVRNAFDAAKAKSVFHWSDVVHTHAAMTSYAPPNTFCMTILRDPVERLVSQISDWRRLGPSDTEPDPSFIQACVADSATTTLRGFLEQHAYGDSRMLFDNYLTRAIAAGRIGRLVLEIDNAERLLDIALESLESDYSFVGLTEELDLSRNAICGLLGLPPARPVPVLNESRNPSAPDPEGEQAGELLDDLTRADRELYRRACQLFNRRHRRLAETYDTEAFERHHASRLLGELRGMEYGDCTRYSVRDPIIGSGFHGRDSAGDPACAVWTGPGPGSTLYIPTPPDMRLSLLVWIRGYAAPRQREQLRVKIDGKPAGHRFRRPAGHADVLVTEATTIRDFVRLELDVGETACCLEPEGHDPRPRGIAIDGYGWRRI